MSAVGIGAGRIAAAALVLAALGGCVSGRPEAGSRPGGASGQVQAYTVRPGDSLSAIALRFGVEMSALARTNGLAPPYIIRVGQSLAVPRAAPRGRAARFETRPVVQPVVQPTPRPAANDLAYPVATPAPLPPLRPAPSPGTASLLGAPRLVWPADGPVDQQAGRGESAPAMVFAVHKGAAVRSAAGGTVVFAGPEPGRTGQMVMVDHGAGWLTAYGQLARLVVQQGERIASGARLGFAGAPDGSRFASLRFELRRDNRPVDPTPLLPPRL